MQAETRDQSLRIPSLYAQCYMDDTFNYIKD